MARFIYSAVTLSGDLVKGDAEFAHAGELIESLRTRKLTLHRSLEIPAWLQALSSGKLGANLTAEFCYFLAEYVRAGAELRLALLDMAESTPSPRVRSLSRALLSRIERGDTLSAAMRQTKAFPSLVSNLAKVGEETGRIDIALTAAARHFEQVVQTRNALTRALLYPALALLTLVAAVVFWVGYVLPKLAVLFQSMMPKLPPSTRAVLDGATWLRDQWPWLTAVLLVLLIVFPVALRQPALRPLADWLKWHAPLVMRLERARTAYLFFSNLAVMYKAGMTLTGSLKVLMSDPGNLQFGRRLSGLETRIAKGASFSEAMQWSRGFDSIAIGMMRLGESTGSLAGQSERLGDYYQQRLKSQGELVVRMFEPMVLLVIGLLLMLVVITIVAPVYELAQQAVGGVR